MCHISVSAHVYGKNSLNVKGEQSKQVSEILLTDNYQPLRHLHVARHLLNTVVVAFTKPSQCIVTASFNCHVTYHRLHDNSNDVDTDTVSTVFPAKCRGSECEVPVSGLSIGASFKFP